MHTRRLASLLIGAWLAGSAFMIWVATGNFRSVEEVLRARSTKAQREINDIGPARARALLRYHASEQNRHYFYYWEIVQIALGVVLAVVLLFATNGNKLIMALVAFMLAIILIMHFRISPQITELGRAIDFAGSEQMSVERDVFWNYHKAYSAMEVLKIGLGLLLGVRMLYSTHQLKRRSGKSTGKNINRVNDSNNTHINR